MRRDAHALSPVVAVMLLLLITVVLATSVYLIASSLIQELNIRPYVGIAPIESNLTSTTVMIAEISQSNIPLSSFRTVLLVNDTSDPTSAINPLNVGTYGAVTFKSIDGYLSAGDRFTIQFLPDRSYSLRILWLTGGEQIGKYDWIS